MRAVTVIPLKSYRIAPRKPWLRIDVDAVVMRMPSWFGGRTFSVPLASTGVVDLDLVQESPEVEGTVYAEPVVIPYVYTTGPATLPNLGLVFAEPVPLPKLRWLVASQVSGDVPKRSARDGRPAGRYVDGLLLRAVDPQTAIELLAASGAERVTAPEAWLDARRARIEDPEVVAEMEAKDRRFTWTGRIGATLFFGGLASAFALDAWVSEDAAVPAFVVAGAGAVLHQGAAYLSERAWFRPRDGGRRRRRGDGPAG